MKLTRTLFCLAALLLLWCGALLTWLYWPVSLLVIAACLFWRRKDWFGWAYGTARWADAADLRRAGMLDATHGVIVGTLESPPPSVLAAGKALFDRRIPDEQAVTQLSAALRRKPQTGLVRLSRAVHTAVFAPTGVGKGVSIVIPHLLTCPDASVVVDFKGELAKATAEHRKRAFGHRIVMLDPFRVVTQRPDCFNPLDWIDADAPTALDECRDLAEALVVRTGQEKEPHWLDSAEVWIGSMTALVVALGEAGDRSLQTVRALLSDADKMQRALAAMSASDAWDGMLARLGHQLGHFKDKELGSTLTTTNRFMRFLDTPVIAESTRSSSFDPAELNGGRMTVYLTLPPDHMRAQSALLRMWVGSLLRAVVKGGLRG